MIEKKEIYWVCSYCGNKYGKPRPILASFHPGVCDICGHEIEVTNAENYGIYDTDDIKEGQIRCFKNDDLGGGDKDDGSYNKKNSR